LRFGLIAAKDTLTSDDALIVEAALSKGCSGHWQPCGGTWARYRTARTKPEIALASAETATEQNCFHLSRPCSCASCVGLEPSQRSIPDYALQVHTHLPSCRNEREPVGHCARCCARCPLRLSMAMHKVNKQSGVPTLEALPCRIQLSARYTPFEVVTLLQRLRPKRSPLCPPIRY
jgi:hypothetical protein